MAEQAQKKIELSSDLPEGWMGVIRDTLKTCIERGHPNKVVLTLIEFELEELRHKLLNSKTRFSGPVYLDRVPRGWKLDKIYADGAEPTFGVVALREAETCDLGAERHVIWLPGRERPVFIVPEGFVG